MLLSREWGGVREYMQFRIRLDEVSAISAKKLRKVHRCAEDAIVFERLIINSGVVSRCEVI